MLISIRWEEAKVLVNEGAGRCSVVMIFLQTMDKGQMQYNNSSGGIVAMYRAPNGGKNTAERKRVFTSPFLDNFILTFVFLSFL